MAPKQRIEYLMTDEEEDAWEAELLFLEEHGDDDITLDEYDDNQSLDEMESS